MFMWLRRKSHRQVVIDLWNSPDSAAMDYYTKAESEEWLRYFWEDGSRFRRQFDRLDLTSVLDLACGQGRHTAKIVDRAGSVICFDTSPVALAACRERFRGRSNVRFVLSPDGKDLEGIEDGSLTAVFSYDAMVHFDMECVFGYLHEIRRVLREDGLALLHISAFAENSGRDFRRNPDWRAFMREPAFRNAAAEARLHIQSYEAFAWSGEVITDALVLLSPA